MKTVVLDPGHGGIDSGAVGNGLKEKDLTLKIASLAKEKLDAIYTVDCKLTRSTNKTMLLTDRTKMANAAKADCLVSIHINSAADNRANGFESFVYTTDGEGSRSFALQKELHNRLSKIWVNKKRRDRGMKKANFHMVREFKGAAVLLEFGFIVNKDDARLLKSDQFIDANADALAEGIADYLGLERKFNTEDAVYRVSVEGEQVGAYADSINITRQVEKAVNAGKDSIDINLIK